MITTRNIYKNGGALGASKMFDLIRAITINGALNSLPLSIPECGSYFTNNYNKMPSTNVVIETCRICSVLGYNLCYGRHVHGTFSLLDYKIGTYFSFLIIDEIKSHLLTIKRKRKSQIF